MKTCFNLIDKISSILRKTLDLTNKQKNPLSSTSTCFISEMNIPPPNVSRHTTFLDLSSKNLTKIPEWLWGAGNIYLIVLTS